MRGIIWFKKDLRILDNPALHAASLECTDGLIAVYFIDCEMWQKHHTSHCQIQFILRGLVTLQANLATLNIPLLIENISTTEKIPAFLFKLAEQHRIQKLFFNNELEVNEKRRDQAVTAYLSARQISVNPFNDQLILTPTQVKTGQNNYFKVFTPFKREWLRVFHTHAAFKNLPKPRMMPPLNVPCSTVPNQLVGIHSTIDWPAGEKIAHKKLNDFIRHHLQHYAQERDYPALHGTSQLSPYLAVGMISVKTCFLAAYAANGFELDTGNQGALTWMSELIWREFYRHILIAVPRVCMNRAYKLETEKLPWCKDEKLLSAWQQGRTGFPIVDAAMRQLNTTGWMHNRLRMIVAMFLSKNLFLDWRLGEQYFAKHLIDFDFASNNGGWQWSASTGTDAVPYFRIFNPTSQSQRFDSEGQFIRHYCPESQGLDNKTIHQPQNPIINYSQSRQRVLAEFKKLAKRSPPFGPE